MRCTIVVTLILGLTFASSIEDRSSYLYNPTHVATYSTTGFWPTIQIKEPEVWIDAEDGGNSWMSYGYIYNSSVIEAAQQVHQ